ncbi:MAG: hypothetical protein KGI84_09970 [Elusimicrobia bacterium]|nr:hypothetical protein [Elusimicrobiota bacterium]
MGTLKNTKNLALLAIVAQGLKSLKEKVVFVGGAIIDLHLDPAAPESRPTDDVDCVVEIAAKSQYHDFEGELRKLGFAHPMGEKAPICRWKFQGVQVDVMPTKGAVLGFNNRWYQDGMERAERFTLPDGLGILAFSAPYLLASKIEAFLDRGKGDYLGSADMEDIIALLDGSPDIEDKIRKAPADIREYLAMQLGRMLDTESFLNGLDGNLRAGPAGIQRVERCIGIIKRIAQRK